MLYRPPIDPMIMTNRSTKTADAVTNLQRWLGKIWNFWLRELDSTFARLAERRSSYFALSGAAATVQLERDCEVVRTEDESSWQAAQDSMCVETD